MQTKGVLASWPTYLNVMAARASGRTFSKIPNTAFGLSGGELENDSDAQNTYKTPCYLEINLLS